MKYDVLEKAFEYVRHAWPAVHPACGLILGSGWSAATETLGVEEALPYESIPGLGRPGVVGHSGRLVWASADDIDILIFEGRRHWYEGEGWTPVALPVYLLRRMDARALFLTNAAGGIREDLRPGDLMLITDHINRMGASPLVGPHHSIWGPRFPDQTNSYDFALQSQLQRAAGAQNIPLKSGVYVASSGPEYETPAEVRAFAAIGADAVGMSTVPEAILGRAVGLRLLGLSCITNRAASRTQPALSHAEVVAVTQAVLPRMQALLQGWWEEFRRDETV